MYIICSYYIIRSILYNKAHYGMFIWDKNIVDEIEKEILG